MNREVQVCGAKLPPSHRIVKDGKAETTVLKESGSTTRIRGVKKPLSPVFVTLPIMIVVAYAGFQLWKMEGFRASEVAAGPFLSIPASGEIDHRFQFLSPWESVAIPSSERFDPPMGTEHGGFVYNAQKFWEMNEKRGGHHTGDDLNGIGGMNTDLGDPVFCTADGLVLYAGEASPGWGKLVVVAHRTRDGNVLHSMYAHLNRIDVSAGNLIARGGRVGTVGTANGYYPAHLHFEIRASDEVDIGAGYEAVPLDRLDPAGTVDSLRNATDDDLSRSPLKPMLTARDQE
jgi:murein DD-endopeptidase MepM/ murein hydrolase activator NlpD